MNNIYRILGHTMYLQSFVFSLFMVSCSKPNSPVKPPGTAEPYQDSPVKPPGTAEPYQVNTEQVIDFYDHIRFYDSTSQLMEDLFQVDTEQAEEFLNDNAQVYNSISQPSVVIMEDFSQFDTEQVKEFLANNKIRLCDNVSQATGNGYISSSIEDSCNAFLDKFIRENYGKNDSANRVEGKNLNEDKNPI